MFTRKFYCEITFIVSREDNLSGMQCKPADLQNNRFANQTLVWVHDDVGDILSRIVYPYTTGERTQLCYNWGELLTAYNYEDT